MFPVANEGSSYCIHLECPPTFSCRSFLALPLSTCGGDSFWTDDVLFFCNTVEAFFCFLKKLFTANICNEYLQLSPAVEPVLGFLLSLPPRDYLPLSLLPPLFFLILFLIFGFDKRETEGKERNGLEFTLVCSTWLDILLLLLYQAKNLSWGAQSFPKDHSFSMTADPLIALGEPLSAASPSHSRVLDKALVPLGLHSFPFRKARKAWTFLLPSQSEANNCLRHLTSFSNFSVQPLYSLCGQTFPLSLLLSFSPFPIFSQISSMPLNKEGRRRRRVSSPPPQSLLPNTYIVIWSNGTAVSPQQTG